MSYELKKTDATSPVGFDALYCGVWPTVVRSIGASVSEKRAASICEQSIEVNGCDLGTAGRAFNSYADGTWVCVGGGVKRDKMKCSHYQTPNYMVSCPKKQDF
jgi:hypothetical protein